MSLGLLQGVKNDIVRLHKNRKNSRDVKQHLHNWNYNFLKHDRIEKLIYFQQIQQGSAKMLQLMLSSQLHFYNLSTDHLELSYDPLESSMKEFIEESLKPFRGIIHSKKMSVNYLEY